MDGPRTETALFTGLTEILYFVTEPKRSAYWLSRFFEGELCCLEEPVHRCRVRVGAQHFRFEPASTTVTYHNHEVAFWSVDDLGAAIQRCAELDGNLIHCPSRRAEGDFTATIEGPGGVQIGLIGRVPEMVTEAPLPPVHVRLVRSGRAHRVLSLTGEFQAEIDYSARDTLSSHSGMDHRVRVNGRHCVSGSWQSGERCWLPVTLPADTGRTAWLEILAGTNWFGRPEIAEMRLLLDHAVIYAEANGDVHVEKTGLPIPAADPAGPQDDLPRPADPG